MSRPSRRGPRPSRQRVDQSSASTGWRSVSTGPSPLWPSSRTRATAVSSSGAKATSVPHLALPPPVRFGPPARRPASLCGRPAFERRWPTSSCSSASLSLDQNPGARLGASPSSLASSRNSRSCSSVIRSGDQTCSRSRRSPLLRVPEWVRSPAAGAPASAECRRIRSRSSPYGVGASAHRGGPLGRRRAEDRKHAWACRSKRWWLLYVQRLSRSPLGPFGGPAAPCPGA